MLHIKGLLRLRWPGAGDHGGAYGGALPVPARRGGKFPTILELSMENMANVNGVSPVFFDSVFLLSQELW